MDSKDLKDLMDSRLCLKYTYMMSMIMTGPIRPTMLELIRRVPRFVGLSVRPSVTLYFFGFFAVFGLTAPAQMIK